MTNENDALRAQATKLIEQYGREIDGLTRPACKAAASFTKRQAADLKAGYADGVLSMLTAVRAAESK